jgi:PAS domain
MKHQSTRDFFSYWDSQRAGAPAPTRGQIDPSDIRPLVADTFVLSAIPKEGFPFTVAGTRVRALLARNLIGKSFSELFFGADRADIDAILSGVMEDAAPLVAGLSATATTGAPVARAPATALRVAAPYASRPHRFAAGACCRAGLRGRTALRCVILAIPDRTGGAACAKTIDARRADDLRGRQLRSRAGQLFLLPFGPNRFPRCSPRPRTRPRTYPAQVKCRRSRRPSP